MKLASIPARVPVPFADQGTKNAIPVNSQIGVKDGAASYTDGFPPLTMTPIAAGGIPPAGGDFNGILNAITQSLRWACAGGLYSYDDAFSSSIGGYPKGALIQNAAGDVVWLNTTDDNSTNPDTGTGWIPVIRYGLTAVELAGTNVTLTPEQAAKETIVLTGTLTANVQVIMPAWVETWLIINNTTGNFTVAVKPAAGSGVNLAPSKSSQVYGDGTNIFYGSLMVRNNLGEIKAAGTNSQAEARYNLGLDETLNPSKRVSIGPLGAGLFDGSKPSINIGDSDSGFIFESDGVIGIYANNQKIAELTNTGIKAVGYLTILSGALILDNDTYFLRHSSADNAGFSGNNIELASWNGIGFPCTYDQITRIYLNTRTGAIGLTGDLKAGGNVYSGPNAWLDQTGNLFGSAWGTGVSLKQYIANQIATQKSYIDNGFNKKNTASLAVNGWHKDESTGIITQWGSGNTTTIGANVTFPIPFPNVCTSITSNERNNNITPVIINLSGVGKTGFTVQAWNNNATRVDSSISWVATGY
ncbi:gp53-like domain-containing protein [Enterobacter roggenkampii]|uniref:gp53-like domain-containing protein n=1 Tax=Enterobacter roggenkampii TaxID=1812935 RepID=UPI00388DAE70